MPPFARRAGRCIAHQTGAHRRVIGALPRSSDFLRRAHDRSPFRGGFRQRAEAVRSALVAGGAPAAQISAAGYGNARPLGPETTAEGRAQNSRVEIASPAIRSATRRSGIARIRLAGAGSSRWPAPPDPGAPKGLLFPAARAGRTGSRVIL